MKTGRQASNDNARLVAITPATNKLWLQSVALCLTAIMLTAIVSSQAFAQYDSDTSIAPAIGGYSPVSYFTENKAERGDPQFSVEHDGEVYFLTSQEQVSLFWQSPDKYQPRHKACPYSLAYGMVLPLDPTSFKIIGDSLLLFHRSEEKDALLEWNNSELSEDELLRRAEANAFRIKF